jgi:hypothetical protein
LVMGKKNPEWNVTPEKELKVTVNIPWCHKIEGLIHLFIFWIIYSIVNGTWFKVTLGRCWVSKIRPPDPVIDTVCPRFKLRQSSPACSNTLTCGYVNVFISNSPLANIFPLSLVLSPVSCTYVLLLFKCWTLLYLLVDYWVSEE